MDALSAIVHFALPFAVVGILVLLLRWTWSPRKGSLAARTPRRGEPDDYGLLVPIAVPADRAEAMLLTARLKAAGIRSTLVRTTRGPRLMVWDDAAEGARRLLRDVPNGAGGTDAA